MEKPNHPHELADLIESLTVVDHDGEDGYQQSADALWKAAAAAFNYAADKVGATGFQASWAALRFHREVMHVDGPFAIFMLHDALYPQYDLPDQLRRFIEDNRGWLRYEASRKLAEYEAGEARFAHPDVVAHWRKLAEYTGEEL